MERVNGRITGADPDWSHLVGDKMQLTFSVTLLKTPPILHEGMISVGSMFILPSTGPAVSAQPNGALKSELFAELQWDWVGFGGEDPCTWRGEVWGDINGAICITLTGARFPGETEHYSEQWVITTDDGEIAGVTHKGVWRFANLKFVGNGEVTDATGAWSDLVGSHWHISGTTTEFPVPPGTPVSGPGALIISGS